MALPETHISAPLYLQVKDRLIAGISNGDWRPGDVLPSEIALAQLFDVSQGTVRKALDELAAANLVVRRQGKGTYVASHTPQRALFHFFHLTDEGGRKRLPTSRVVGVKRRRANRFEISELQLGPQARVIEIERVRELDDRPAIWEQISMPASLFGDLDRLDPKDLPNTLYLLYEEKYGILVARARERLRAVSAKKREAELLNVAIGSPLLQIERLALALDGRPVEMRLSRCDTRDYHYESDLA